MTADDQAAAADDTVTYEWMVRSPGRGEFTDTVGFRDDVAAHAFAANDRANGLTSSVWRREVRRGPWIEENNHG
jgi:hypothetical protein